MIIDEETPLRHRLDERLQYQSQASELSTNSGSGDTDGRLHDHHDRPKWIFCILPPGHMFLILVAFLYGTLNVSLRMVYAEPGPPTASALSCTRGWLALVCFIPFLANQPRSDSSSSNNITPTHSIIPARPLVHVASELALWNFGAQALLTLGLESTESARASFFTQLSVVMTPAISAIAGQTVQSTVWIGCVIALCGLVLLCDEGGFRLVLSLGDVTVLAGALCWSMYLFRLSAVGEAYNEVRLQGTKTAFLAVLYSIWVAIEVQFGDVTVSPWPGWKNPITWLLIFYSALGPGTVADMVQQKGQATVSASVANVVLSMEPVFTAILGRIFLGEATTLFDKIGGGLIIIASVVATR